MNSRKTWLPVHIPDDFARIYSVDSSTGDAKGLVVVYKPDAVLIYPDVHFLNHTGFYISSKCDYPGTWGCESTSNKYLL